MDQRKITCSCGRQFTEEEFSKHFNSCQSFKLQFKEFDNKFGELLKAYSEPKERLLIVRFLLKEYTNVIDRRLKKHFANLAQKNSQYQDKNGPPPLGDGAPPSMNFGGMNQNHYAQNNQQNNQKSQLFQNAPSSGNISNSGGGNPYAMNNNQFNQPPQNPYKQDNSNPYQSQNNNPKIVKIIVIHIKITKIIVIHIKIAKIIVIHIKIVKIIVIHIKITKIIIHIKITKIIIHINNNLNKTIIRIPIIVLILWKIKGIMQKIIMILKMTLNLSQLEIKKIIQIYVKSVKLILKLFI